MRPSARAFNDVVTFSTLLQGPDASSDTGKRSFSAGTPLRCRVTPARETRVVVHAGVESVVSHRVYFPSAPDDASGDARADYAGGGGAPHGLCGVEDRLAWAPYPQAPAVLHKLYALGPAMPAAGDRRVWFVDCELRP